MSLYISDFDTQQQEEQVQEEEEEFQFILRLPPHLAEKINKTYKANVGISDEDGCNIVEAVGNSNSNNSGLQDATASISGHTNGNGSKNSDNKTQIEEEKEEDVEYWIEYDGDEYDSDLKDRKYVFYYGKEQYDAILMDLPTVTESYKTFDSKTLYKSNNVCQVLVVADTPRAIDLEANVFPQVEKPDKLFCEDGISSASQNIYRNYHEPARKLIYGQGGEYPSYKTTKKVEKILTSWLQDKTRTVVREDFVNKLAYMSRVESYDLVDQDDGYPLDGELLDDEMMETVCNRIWEMGKEERKQKQKELEALELEKKRKAEEEMVRATEVKGNDHASLPLSTTQQHDSSNNVLLPQMTNNIVNNGIDHVQPKPERPTEQVSDLADDALGGDFDDLMFDDDELQGMLVEDFTNDDEDVEDFANDDEDEEGEDSDVDEDEFI